MKKKIAILAILLFVVLGSIIHFGALSVHADPGCESKNGYPPPQWCQQ